MIMDLQIFAFTHNQHSEGGRKEHIMDYDTGELLCGRKTDGGSCTLTSFDYDYLMCNKADIISKHFCSKCLFKALDLMIEE